jgi:hypothetical protein
VLLTFRDATQDDAETLRSGDVVTNGVSRILCEPR